MKTSPILPCRSKQRGFALIATISVMVLLVMIALAMLSLSTIEIRNSSLSKHQAVARSNARMALMIALGELQKHAGPDQRVTARAAILESGTDSVANENWLGVWSTTFESKGKEWPLIGKGSDSSAAPYSRQGAYEDLRHTQATLSNDAWKTKQLRSWLVSKRSNKADIKTPLKTSDDHVVEILGRGTLGDALNASQYSKQRVLVEKVDVQKQGAYAWYVTDNNQKASIDPLTKVDNVEAALEASPRGNPVFLRLADNSEPYKKFTEDALKYEGKLMTYSTASLTQGDKEGSKKALKEHYHHLTFYSPGLFVDTLRGGLRRDLTPLLLAKKSQDSVDFSSSQGAATRIFSSGYPIIPGPNHGVLGPSFGALRNWALHKYTDLTDAETDFENSAKRMRPTAGWPHGISDGACADASTWAEQAPKIHPVMTDSRWHFYYSYFGSRLRVHIIPRVCLWNPYNRALTTSSMTVLMPNPFYQQKHGVNFFVEDEHVQALQEKHPKEDGKDDHIFHSWTARTAYEGDLREVYKFRTKLPFPNDVRFLAFTLEGTTLSAGACHVYSPKVSSPTLSESGINLQAYQPHTVSNNVLSSTSVQGTDHFYYDLPSSAIYQISVGKNWKNLAKADVDELDLGRIFDYQLELQMQVNYKIDVENFPFILKKGSSSSLEDLYKSNDYPTLQLINNGYGGVSPSTHFAYDKYWTSAKQAPGKFGNLETFSDNPMKDSPPTHQIGAKLLWFDESATEALNPPLRVERWTNDHMAMNVCSVANWNVRAQLTTRSPASQCAQKWYMSSTGPWMIQFVPHPPQELFDSPSLSASGNFVKNPFGASNSALGSKNVVLFDLPSPKHGVLSLAKLRHAMLSPYSWNPTYIVGHSLRDLHAPADSTAHPVAVDGYTEAFPATRWDYMLGGYKSSLGHGAYAKEIDSQGLMQIGNQAATRAVGSENLSSADEVLAYDIAYEVNHNLWDSYFISGMPLDSNTGAFAWDPTQKKYLWNRRYQFNYNSGVTMQSAVSLVADTDGVSTAFWRNAELLKNRASFNVNSTSVEAWTTFLSGTLGIARPLKSGGGLGDDVLSFARYRNPAEASTTSDADPESKGGWSGARQLTEDQIRTLATKIVEEVKSRGPFISIADFVNRRLVDDQNDTSRMGVLDAAIKAAQINEHFEDAPEYLSTAENSKAGKSEADNNMEVFRLSYRYNESGGGVTSAQPKSQVWGIPGFLTQSDILEPIAPSLSVRGDTFTIRTYGESSVDGVVKARAWVEAVVERTPRYVAHVEPGSSKTDGNEPVAAPLYIDYGTGEYTDGKLTDANQKFGRQFVIKSFRWLSSHEI